MLDAHQAKTSVADIVILALHITKREHRISRRVFLECKKIAEEAYIRNWASEVRCILAECNLLPWWWDNSCGNRLSPSEFRNVVSCLIVFRGESEKWKTEVIAENLCNFQGKV